MKLTKIMKISIGLALLIVIESLEVRLFSLPAGGSISLASLIYIFLAINLNIKEAIILFFLWRIACFFTTPIFVVSFFQAALDYVVAFSGFLLAALVVKFDRLNLLFWNVLANIFRYFIHVISGIWYFSRFTNGQPVLNYSILYNLSYMLPTLILHIALIWVLFPSFSKRQLNMNEEKQTSTTNTEENNISDLEKSTDDVVNDNK